jgi:endonuclease G
MSRNNEKNRQLLLIKLLVKHPVMMLFLLLLGCGWYGYQAIFIRSGISFQGEPQAQSLLNFATWNKTLTNQAFIVGYSDKRGNPLWVAYRLEPVNENAPHLPRPSGFKTDNRVSNPVKSKDYDRTGYDRGHMAPNYAISALYGEQAQLETFLMSNITPQKPNLNRKFWQRLEEVEISYFTRLSPNIWVTTGPIFFDKPRYLKKGSSVQIPTAFYKLYAMETKLRQVYLLAFLVPQTVTGNESLENYLVTVDKIEELTGLDFFHDLEDPHEQELESQINAQPWKLTAVSQLPSRY